MYLSNSLTVTVVLVGMEFVEKVMISLPVKVRSELLYIFITWLEMTLQYKALL